MLVHNMAFRGGTFIRAHSLARQLARRGHKVTLLAAATKRRLRSNTRRVDGVTVVEMPSVGPRRLRHGGLSLLDVASRVGYAFTEDFDLVHGFDHRPTTSFPALLYRCVRGVPYLADWCDLWGSGGLADLRGGLERMFLGPADHYWERRTRRWADGLTVISSTLAKQAQRLGVSPKKVLLVPAGANVDIIRPLPKQRMRRTQGLPVDGRIAVHSGFAPYDTALLGEAFVRVAEHDSKAWLLLVGGAFKDVIRLAREAGFADRVLSLGFVPYHRIGEFLACGDVMLLPYSNRGVNAARFPNKSADYLAAGRPVVTNPTGDLGRMVQEEGVGLVADETPESFADAILRLFQDTDLREEMGLRARAVAERRFAWRILARDVEAFYRGLLSA